MDEGLNARIQHEIAELRAAYPRVSRFQGVLDDWGDAGERRYALRLDIRWPQHQALLSSGERADPYSALRCAFDAAAHHLARELRAVERRCECPER